MTKPEFEPLDVELMRLALYAADRGLRYLLRRDQERVFPYALTIAYNRLIEAGWSTPRIVNEVAALIEEMFSICHYPSKKRFLRVMEFLDGDGELVMPPPHEP